MVSNSRPFVPRGNVSYGLGIQLNRKALLNNLTLSEFNNRRCKHCGMIEPSLTEGWCDKCIVNEFNTD
jgi:hypothetical protein